MSDVFNYKGYTGSMETSAADNCLYGKILFVRDLVTFEGQTVQELRQAFEESVDDYLEMCAELGVEPKKPCNGTFNVRIRPELHEKLAYRAVIEGEKQNAIVAKSIEQYLNKDEIKPHENHYHKTKIIFTGEISDISNTGVTTDEQVKFFAESPARKNSTVSH